MIKELDVYETYSLNRRYLLIVVTNMSAAEIAQLGER